MTAMVAEPMPRRRWRPFVFLLFTLILGLASRHFSHFLPWWLAKNAGDVLYATMMFWLIACIRPVLPILQTAIFAFAVCVAIEFAKLIPWAWLTALRHSPGGHLILGTGFHAFNIVCYAVGACLGAAWAQAVGKISSAQC